MASENKGMNEDSPEDSTLQGCLESNSMQLRKLREVLDALYEKLEPVLGPELPDKLAASDSTMAARSPIAQMIIEQTETTRVMTRRLIETIGRIEL